MCESGAGHGAEPAPQGFVELTEAWWRLDEPGAAPLGPGRCGPDRPTSPRSTPQSGLALGIPTVQASTMPGRAVTPETLDPTWSSTASDEPAAPDSGRGGTNLIAA